MSAAASSRSEPVAKGTTSDSSSPFGIHLQTTESERSARAEFARRVRTTAIPDQELLPNLGLFLNRQSLSRILFLHELYLRVREVHGVIMEFGARWGQTLALMSNFRGMHEPYNYNRRVVGFDTFAGFPSVTPADGNDPAARPGHYAVTKGWREELEEILRFHESESPLPHIGKHELVVGDVTRTLPQWLEAHPEAIVALAYFDLDLYEPTAAALRALSKRLTVGSVLAFDQLCHPAWPGETRALAETLGLSAGALRHVPWYPSAAYMVIEAPVRQP